MYLKYSVVTFLVVLSIRYVSARNVPTDDTAPVQQSSASRIKRWTRNETELSYVKAKSYQDRDETSQSDDEYAPEDSYPTKKPCKCDNDEESTYGDAYQNENDKPSYQTTTKPCKSKTTSKYPTTPSAYKQHKVYVYTRRPKRTQKPVYEDEVPYAEEQDQNEEYATTEAYEEEDVETYKTTKKNIPKKTTASYDDPTYKTTKKYAPKTTPTYDDEDEYVTSKTTKKYGGKTAAYQDEEYEVPETTTKYSAKVDATYNGDSYETTTKKRQPKKTTSAYEEDDYEATTKAYQQKSTVQYDDDYQTTVKYGTASYGASDEYQQGYQTAKPKTTKKAYVATESYAEDDEYEAKTTTKKYRTTTAADYEPEDGYAKKTTGYSDAYEAATTKRPCKKKTTTAAYEDDYPTSKTTKKRTTVADYGDEYATPKATKKRTTASYKQTTASYGEESHASTQGPYYQTEVNYKPGKKPVHYEDYEDDVAEVEYATTARYAKTTKAHNYGANTTPRKPYERVTNSTYEESVKPYAKTTKKVIYVDRGSGYKEVGTVDKGKVITVQQNATRETDIVIRLIKKAGRY